MKTGQRIKIKEHFPPNSDAYYEATPQRPLSQSRFIHIRRVTGLVCACAKEIKRIGRELASVRIAAAIATMRRCKRIRAPYFKDLLDPARKQSMNPPSRARDRAQAR